MGRLLSGAQPTLRVIAIGDRWVRLPFARTDGDLPLPELVRSAILAVKPPESGERQLKPAGNLENVV